MAHATKTTTTPDLAQLTRLLHERFGFDAFRTGQADVLSALLQHGRALAVFPTGAGKSLCYQLPALVFDGLTLVVSPLIALMKDQIDALQAKGIAAARMDSSLEKEEHADVTRRIRSGELKLLYVAPERFANERFLSLLSQVKIALFAVDEAHSIAEWGHNFRPDYLKLATIAAELKVERVLALTATATPEVVESICRRFEIPKDAAVVTGFYRENLELRTSVVDVANKDKALLAALEASPPGPGIVYVTLQKTAERVAQTLAAAGYAAEAYHAGLDPEVRSAVQQRFMDGTDAIVVATIAFGMGIDKADVRKVIHVDLPKSLEGYSQEIGRAGRDGLPSVVHLLACADDAGVLEGFACGDTPTRAALTNLVTDVTARGASFDLDLYALSDEHDLRPLVLRTALTHLELFGAIRQGTPWYASMRVRPLQSVESILAKFPGEKRAFVASLFERAKQGRIWLTLALERFDVDSGERQRAIAALEFLSEQGLIELAVADVRHRYTRGAADVPVQQLVDQLAERFSLHERREIERIGDVLALVTSSSCQSYRLARHFGEDRKGGCGRCSFCRSQRALVLPPPAPPPAFSSLVDESALRALAAKHPAALAAPRQRARFLCGLTSPATTKAKLSRHPAFGQLASFRFHDVLSWCEAQTPEHS